MTLLQLARKGVSVINELASELLLTKASNRIIAITKEEMNIMDSLLRILELFEEVTLEVTLKPLPSFRTACLYLFIVGF